MRHNYEKARERMVREQLMPRGITDARVLAAMNTVPRHLFVENAFEAQAYGDHPLPIGEGQTISQPYIVALMTQAMNLQGHEKVLEIGTGSGYQAAVLAQLCDKVYTVERLKSLHIGARKLFDKLQYFNILCRIDDGTLGWQEHSPYDAIMVTAAGPKVPDPLVAQLADPGIMVIPIGLERWSQELVVITKQEGRIAERVIEQVRFVSLIGNHGWQP
jgi:protein-L-isoaspartate(D-aspartate) O-methyltransferase